jgi:D-threonate/D-erythronate kinase
MTIVRLLADDLTGALDTAAEFVPLTGTLPVVWANRSGLDLTGSVALDSATREFKPREAAAQLREWLGHLRDADIAFKKIDSLLRGPTMAEIAACMRAGFWRYCALAPAFPYQGRITRGGRQYRRDGHGWSAVSADLIATLQAFDVPAHRGPTLQPGVTVFDAETDADLQRVAATVRGCCDPVLWVGSGGLAQALAAGSIPAAPMPLPRPILGLFGSDQPATADQLAACAPHWLELDDAAFHLVPGRLSERGVVLVSFRLPPDTARASAAARIAAAIGRLTDRLEPPGTVVVAGGETLRSLCDAVGTTSLLVQGRLVPGVPTSVMQGGRWDGITVVSKSGAFGCPHLLRDLILERTDL